MHFILCESFFNVFFIGPKLDKHRSTMTKKSLGYTTFNENIIEYYTILYNFSMKTYIGNILKS